MHDLQLRQIRVLELCMFNNVNLDQPAIIYLQAIVHIWLKFTIHRHIGDSLYSRNNGNLWRLSD